MTTAERTAEPTSGGQDVDVDAVIVGAGFSGLYMLHRLRDQLGLSARVYEAGDRRRRHLVLEPLPGRARATSRA